LTLYINNNFIKLRTNSTVAYIQIFYLRVTFSSRLAKANHHNRVVQMGLKPKTRGSPSSQPDLLITATVLRVISGKKGYIILQPEKPIKGHEGETITVSLASLTPGVLIESGQIVRVHEVHLCKRGWRGRDISLIRPKQGR